MIATLDAPDTNLHIATPVERLLPEVAVACRELTKEFTAGDSKTVALANVDLDVYAGQLTFVAGPSGCGKTTLISVIAGLLEPERFAVEFDHAVEVANMDRDMVDSPDHHRASRCPGARRDDRRGAAPDNG